MSNETNKPTEARELTDKELEGIVGGAEGDVREGISEANANPSYAAGKMNEVDGWE